MSLTSHHLCSARYIRDTDARREAAIGFPFVVLRPRWGNRPFNTLSWAKGMLGSALPFVVRVQSLWELRVQEALALNLTSCYVTCSASSNVHLSSAALRSAPCRLPRIGLRGLRH
jgi:hypothetical protein